MNSGLIAYLDSVKSRDPAARSRWDVLFYPGAWALGLHRFAHWLWEGRLYFLARLVNHLSRFLTAAQALTTRPVKQAVIAVSALSLLYPEGGIEGYDRDAFLADLVDEGEADVRRCLDAGAHKVQIDFTEGRLALKLDPSGSLLHQFVDLNNAVLDRFDDGERARIGVHTCPGGDQDSTHSADVPYAELLPELFRLHAGNFYLALAGEADPDPVLRTVAAHRPSDATIFVGVIDPIDPTLETPEQVRDRILAAAEHLPADRLGSCDDCGFSPFDDDTSTARTLAFDKITARVEGTRLAGRQIETEILARQIGARLVRIAAAEDGVALEHRRVGHARSPILATLARARRSAMVPPDRRAFLAGSGQCVWAARPLRTGLAACVASPRGSRRSACGIRPRSGPYG